MIQTTNLRRFIAVVALAALPAVALACSIPVFRYAIEHWQPDPYQVFVYHDQELTAEDHELIGWLREQEALGANIEEHLIDMRKPLEPADQARWERLGDVKPPRLVVQLPKRIGDGEAPVSSASWNREELESLVRSPKRSELAERLTRGDVVWVFLDGTTKEENDRLYTLLEEQIAVQQETIKLGEIDEADRKDLAGDPTELKVKFSALRLARDEAAEKWFREILLSIEPDLRDDELKDQPMVFPVFGRARALYALVGQGINADMIKEAAVFLTEGCQCTVKAENPGVDLLVPVRWDDVIEVSEPEEVDLPLVGLGGGTPLAADTANDADQKISAAESKATESKTTEPSIASSTTTESTSLPVADNESVETSIADLERRTEELIGEVNRVSESTEKLLAKTSSPPAPGIGLPIMVMVVLGGIAWVLGMLFKRRS
ncbi:MAG: hypothetical protein RI963_1168 [Planctomycetota bacterium]